MFSVAILAQGKPSGYSTTLAVLVTRSMVLGTRLWRRVHITPMPEHKSFVKRQ